MVRLSHVSIYFSARISVKLYLYLVTGDTVDQQTDYFQHSTKSEIKEEKIYNFYKPIIKRLNKIKQQQTKYVVNTKQHKLWKTIEGNAIEKLKKNKTKTIKVTNNNRKKKNLPAKDRSKSENNTPKTTANISKAKRLKTKSVYLFYVLKLSTNNKYAPNKSTKKSES